MAYDSSPGIQRPDDLNAAAKRFIEQGLNVTVAQGKNPACMGANWHQREFDLDEIERLIEATPCATIGLRAGPIAGDGVAPGSALLMVDIDSPEEEEAAKELLGGQIPPCWWAETGRGQRLIFRIDTGSAPAGRASTHYKASNGASVLVQFGSDGRGAHSIVPPSLHYEDKSTGQWKPTGKSYVWKPGFSPDELGLQAFPAAAAQKLAATVEADEQRKRTVEARLTGVARKEGEPHTGVHRRALSAMLITTKDMQDANDGSRRLFACACRGAEHYLSDACFLATLWEYEEQSHPFPRSFSDSDRIERLRQAERQHDVVVGGALAEVLFGEFVSCSFYGLNDDGNADRLVDLTDDGIKFVADAKRWVHWDAQASRWRFDPEDHAIVHLARKGLSPMVLTELERLQRQEDLGGFEDTIKRDNTYQGFARSSANVTRVQYAVRFAKSAPSMQIRVEDLDSDPYLLGTSEGLVDLKTGQLLPSSRSDLVTKSTDARLGEPTKGERWLRFLDEIFSADAEMIGFMQRLLGQSLIGEQREHILPVWYGKGANGKSVLIDTVSAVLGDYATPMPDGLLTSSKWDKHPTEIASLVGLRLCFAEETNDRAELDEAKVKRLTGGSELRARYMHKDYFSFKPSHTPVLVTNYKPEIRGSDEGIWRRVKVVNFGHTVPSDKRDPDLKAKLLEERDHVLAWLVEGCVDYLQNGLREPEQVKFWTEEYQRESDPFKRFIQENIERKPGGFLATADIEERYRRWSQGDLSFGAPNLARRLKEEYRPLSTNRRTQHGSQRGYKDLALKPEPSYGTAA